jgi:PhnB protein
MTTINIYLTFNGNCLDAFDFYRTVFGGEFADLSRFKDMPSQSEFKVAESEMERIMHVSLPISSETSLMGSDSNSYSGNADFGNNFSISVNTGAKEEAERIFNSLSDGGKVIMPMENTFWGSYFGMLTDKFGINWMVSFELNQP